MRKEEMETHKHSWFTHRKWLSRPVNILFFFYSFIQKKIENKCNCYSGYWLFCWVFCLGFTLLAHRSPPLRIVYFNVLIFVFIVRSGKWIFVVHSVIFTNLIHIYREHLFVAFGHSANKIASTNCFLCFVCFEYTIMLAINTYMKFEEK